MDHKCSICMEFMSEPVRLPCGHLFCLDCVKMQQNMSSYTHLRECALCRKRYAVAEPRKYDRETGRYLPRELVEFKVDEEHRDTLMDAMPLEFYESFLPKLEETI